MNKKIKFLATASVLLIGLGVLVSSCKKDDPKPAVLSSLSVKTAPAKVSYYTGDVLGLSGLVVKLTMDNGTTEDVSFSNFAGKGISCSPANGAELTTASTAVTIKHTATGKNVSQPITVKDVVVTNIAVKTAPTKVTYYAGQTLNLSGLVVILTKNNGTTEDVSFSNFAGKEISCSPANGDVLTASSTAVIITHTATGKNTSQAITFITLTDADGNTYGLIKIGSQIWMAENLKTTKYNDGTSIPLVTNNTSWAVLSTPGYCWYNNDASTYKNTYGALYNFYTVETGKLCPTGWHVPTNIEWTALTTYLGGESVAGGKLKETGTTHWNSPNTGATNETGFTALPGGYRNNNGAFNDIGNQGDWWSSTESGTNNAWFRYMLYNSNSVHISSYYKIYGFPVRCLSLWD